MSDKTREYQKEWHKKNPGYSAEYQRQWRKNNPEKARAQRERGREKSNKWHAEHQEHLRAYRKRRQLAGIACDATKQKEAIRLWRIKNRDYHRAQSAMWNALKRGKICKPKECGNCGISCIPEGHHHKGYAKENRLDIAWLCRCCHLHAHGKRPVIV